MEGKPIMSLAEQVAVSVACGVAAGPAAAISIKYGMLVWARPAA
jgi:hypothetical protein